MINGSLLCGQIRRGLLSIRFLLVLVLAVVIAIFQWWTIRHAGYRLPYHQPTFLDETLLFSSYGSGTTLYQFLFPFLAALAGGSTLAVERRSGRLTFLQARSSYGVVERTSLCSGFLLGALGGVLPYVIDVLLAAGGNPHLSFIDGVDGTVTYVPGTNTLNLSNATITINNNDVIRNEISGLKITVTGTNTIETTSGSHTPLRVKKSLSISGSGTLNCYGDAYYGCSVASGLTLTISGGAQVLFRGKAYGINGGSTSCRLIMSGANTKLTAFGRTNATIRYMQPTLNDGLAITKPVGAYFNSDGTVVGANGSPIYNQSVIISKPAFARGDVNGDGSVSISDVTALIDYLLNGNPSSISLSAADCNQDGSVNIGDVTVLIDYLLKGTW